ncbi:DNA topoisomerase IB [Kibdelosporangium phytohabitans]|uniref:DNA topoisomerase n=1 Tax=Kibdelosporangium phytohabitans TaxID=860235 RepID=A0A0N9I4B1_9PSEU|nr:DNA topoisomerase IB [Kibdelosporangium phytohabitans]ALG09376.1 DNA topoisomerase [Kibdelosporangium phytohabitans]MBE1469355.1 DNA topoisomerase IB [Kibdelosporangium phytohabitans]
MRLRRSDPAGPGLTRRRRGKNWQYLDDSGSPVVAEIRERCAGLVIPPAWREVWISPHPNGHIQAVGVDDAGRRQYIYHEQWRRDRDEEKFERVLDLVEHLPQFREAIDTDLADRGLTCARVHAGALRMLDRGVFRTGGEEYSDDSRGVATLLRDDVSIDRGDLAFCFTAKGGIERQLRIADAKLAKLVKALRRSAADTDRLLVYRDGRKWREVRADSINTRFKELTGEEFTAKDLRTWNATVVAAVEFARAERPGSKTAAKRAEAAVFDQVAGQLGNTRAVARRSYVDPRVVTSFAAGRTIDLDHAGDRREIELAVRDLLSRAKA